MRGPGPTAGQLERLLTVAARVPDHGKLAPWRFVVVDPDQRASFNDMLEAAYRAEVPEPNPAEVEKLRSFGGEAPCLVVVLSRVIELNAIPVYEQQLSAGGAATMLCAAASAMGFVAGWITGWASRSPTVIASLGQAGDRIAGFVFIGTAAVPLDDRPRPDLDTVVRHWDG